MKTAAVFTPPLYVSSSDARSGSGIAGSVDAMLNTAIKGLGQEELAKSWVDNLLDRILNAPPSEVRQSSIDSGNALKSIIASHPDQTQAIIAELAQRYLNAGAETAAHRPLMAELIRNAGLSNDVGKVLDQLAAANPQDTDLNAQHDSGGNQTTLSAADQVRGQSLPSIFPDRNAFGDALRILNPFLNSRANFPDHHGDFSTETVKSLSQMPLDDPGWDNGTVFGEPVPAAQRQTVKDAAATVLLPKNAQVLGEIVGADGTFHDASINAWLTNTVNHATQADGIIESFSQGRPGDCFLLSAVNAVANSPEGRQQIEHSISKNNGTYSIQLAGDPDHTVFKVTQAEVDAAPGNKTSSHGDADVIAFELGIEKYRTLHGETTRDGGNPADIIQLVSGRPDIKTVSKENATPIIEQAAADSGGLTMTLACGVNKDGQPVAFDDRHSLGNHIFAVKSIDLKAGLATIENPWDTTKPRQIAIADLANFGCLSYLAPPSGTNDAAAANTEAVAQAKLAAQGDALANAHAENACASNATADVANAAASAAAEAAAEAAAASQKAQLAAAVPGVGSDATQQATAAAASAADAKVAADRAAEGAKQTALQESNASSEQYSI